MLLKKVEENTAIAEDFKEVFGDNYVVVYNSYKAGNWIDFLSLLVNTANSKGYIVSFFSDNLGIIVKVHYGVTPIFSQIANRDTKNQTKILLLAYLKVLEHESRYN